MDRKKSIKGISKIQSIRNPLGYKKFNHNEIDKDPKHLSDWSVAVGF